MFEHVAVRVFGAVAAAELRVKITASSHGQFILATVDSLRGSSGTWLTS
jgi:hypothetical protein